MKECRECKKLLPDSYFHSKQAICKACDRERAWKANHGLTSEQYIEMYKEQDGRCAICKCYVAEKPLSIDHDHNTGKIRGLLCSNCNAGLGLLGDSVDNLQNAVSYLERNEEF